MKRPAETTPASSAEQTRIALIQAAFMLFGQKGFDATSTREIAALAKANIGSIAYHFGGKEGLREACAAHIVQTIRSIAGPVLADDAPLPQGPDQALTMLGAALDRMVGFIVAKPEAGLIVQFILRELSQPSVALDIVYKGVFEPVHKRFCRVWEAATGEPAESESTRLTVFTLVGQVVYFRIGREAVLRRMGWSTIGPEEAQKVTTIAKSNIAAILKARLEEKK